jgi:hypothetical protein
MASLSSGSATGSIHAVLVRTKHYRWPAAQLNFFLLVMLTFSCALLGIFAQFVQMQNTLALPNVPWYMPYWISAASLSIIWILVMVYLINKRALLPGVVMLGGFVLLVLWMVGLVVVGLEFFGTTGGNVNGACQTYVFSQSPTGQSGSVLAWLQQRNICEFCLLYL